ncbi:MAG TPA: aspartate--tRNA ligase [Candidatus Acidoferrales bacterium]|nr:aspartate--tRNA ligase [Candidatus Acidoferrales bacterium]
MTDATALSRALDDLATPYRTDTCGELRASDSGRQARLAGWVHRRRDHGHLIFLDLRDRHGITQIVVDARLAPEAHALATRVRAEFVLSAVGVVARRLPGMENPQLATGEVELRADALEILSEAKTPPFYINEPDAPIDEALRLRYRYLDIRREPMRDRLLLRSALVRAIRDAHHRAGFVEIETPILIKSTPEGARDFIVPSRLQPGTVYALPQSPQQLKQLLMVAGMDRYFQIARCFRDEDLRGDRQPEFTQLDLEMSFVREQTVMDFVEAMAIEVSRTVAPERPIQDVPFRRFTFEEALERFGSDKPDVRFGMELVDLAPALVGPAGGAATGPAATATAADGGPGAPNTGFGVFDEVLAAGGRIKGIVAPGMSGASRRDIDELTAFARRYGARGLVHVSVDADGSLHSPVGKFLGAARLRALVEAASAAPSDLLLIVADRASVTADVLGRLRRELGERLRLFDPVVLSYCWVYRFPMYQWDAEVQRWDATHNPFSGVVPEDEPLLVTASGDPYEPSPDDPAGRARAMQYDIALNGWELGGGSVRIHRRELLERSFALQGYSRERMHDLFGGILEAFDFGAPPHGGIALGIDRWVALLADQTNIREVMAFPKTSSGTDLMLDAPSAPDPGQYADLGLQYVGPPQSGAAGVEAASS